MKIAIYGAGGVGGYFGGVLQRSGQDVFLLARGPHLDAIRANGLRVLSPRGDFCVRPRGATDSPADIGPVDVVIVAVKTIHLDAVAAGIAPPLGPDTLVVPLLNGVEAHHTLRSAVGRARTAKGLARIISEVASPGVIRHVGVDPYVALAEWDGSESTRTGALLAALQAAGVTAEVPPDIDQALWLKFVFVCSVGGVCAACRMPIGPVRSLAPTRELLRRAMAEIVEIGRARGIKLARDTVQQSMAIADSFPAQGTSSLQ